MSRDKANGSYDKLHEYANYDREGDLYRYNSSANEDNFCF